MMKVSLLQPFLLALAVVHVAHGYPNGPPVKACTSMYPSGHKVDAQTSDPPYELLVSSNTVQLGQDVTVTLKMKTDHDPAYPYFEGVFVQARMANCMSDLPIGTFSVPENDPFLRVMDCHADRPMSAVSHKNHTHQTEKMFTWTAPTSEPGRIYFRATVVKNTETFWTNVYSPYLEDDTDDSNVPGKYCEVQSTVGSASSLAAVTSLVVAAVITSLQLF
ncbi:putative defense protein Hdd11 [Littorina saxatilis]|uniref:Reelin domain-containing protein n=1 Tax=Littorina saxatilis TaxID=31220 RepID=A0AAN9GA04_9CAEN